MKSLHLWLCAAFVVSGVVSNVRADDIHSSRIRFGGGMSSTQLLSHASTWFQSPVDVNVVFRAQSADSGPVPLPADASTTAEPESVTTETTPGTITETPLGLPSVNSWNAFSPPITSDPFLNGGISGPQSYAPGVPGYGGPIPGAAGPGVYSSPGANGRRPYQFGWSHRLDSFLIPSADVSGGGATGNYDELGVDYDIANTAPFIPGWILTTTGQFRYRSWDGPSGGAGLPGSGFRFGSDYELETPQTGPYSVSLGITTSINTDLNSSMSSKAFQLDGRAIGWWQLDQAWSLGLGAMFWDRVHDRVLPYGGLVYRDDFWEWRLMFPESEIRLFIGNEPWWSKWVYFRAKYNVEAYEGIGAGGVQDDVEFEDWQLTFGFQMDAGYYRWFMEGGLLLDREIDYRNSPDVNVDTTYITRVGLRY